MNRKRKKGCTYKRYLSHDAAFIAAKKLWKQRQLVPYKCEFCRGWHLGTNKPKRMEYLYSQLSTQQRAAR